MLALVSILFALALLGLTVYALHKYQTMEVEVNVDRSAPLPPLDTTPDAIAPASDSRDTKPGPVSKPAPAKARPPVKKAAPSASKSWQDAVTRLKNTGEYAEAARLCEKQLPLWGAYNQLCMLARTELKDASLTAQEREALTARLYKTAAIAELLHDKSPDSVKLTNNQLRQLDLGVMEQLDYPYAEIGYAHLRLIRKSDIKFMIEFWGRPPTHLRPREFHADWWQNQVKS